jgi:UPF0716 protein FxsA
MTATVQRPGVARFGWKGKVSDLKRLVLLAILLGFPLLEATLLVQLGGGGHGWWVAAWCVLAALAGIALIKEARFALMARLTAALAEGRFSIAALVASARTVLAGLLLIFPGVISDFIALALLLMPNPRPLVERAPGRMHPGTIIDGEYRRSR